MGRKFCNYSSNSFYSQFGKNKSDDLVDWSDPNNYAWKNFDWDVLGTTQKNYIISLWKKYGGKTSPPNGIKDRKKDSAKRFKFFDLMNLSPTNREALGYHAVNPQAFAGTCFFDLNGNGFASNRINYMLNWGADVSSKKVLDDWVNDTDKKLSLHAFDATVRPSEDVFKLMWMADLVSKGHEKQAGPFSLKLKDGNPILETAVNSENPDNSAEQRYRIDINQASLDRFITYSQNNYTFVKSIILDYLEYYKDPNAIHIDPNEPRPDPVECEKLVSANTSGRMTGNNKKFVMSRFVAGCTNPISNTITGPTKNVNFFRSLPLTLYPEDTFYRDGTLPSLKSGTNNVVSGWVALDAVTFVPWTFVWKFIAREGFWEKETFDKWKKDTGWPPKGATPEPPELPYYVYDDTKSINDNRNDLKNFPYKSVAQVFDEKTNYKFSIYIPYSRTDSTKLKKVGYEEYATTANEEWVKKDARARLWMYRYGVQAPDTYNAIGYNWNDKIIPERELIFLIRMSHGISKSSAPARCTTKFIDPSDDKIKAKIIESTGLQLEPIIQIINISTKNREQFDAHLKNEIEFIRQCGGLIANRNINVLDGQFETEENWGYTAEIPITYNIGTLADRAYVYGPEQQTTIKLKIEPHTAYSWGNGQMNAFGVAVANVPQQLRNHYTCVVHDLYGFSRYNLEYQAWPEDAQPTPLTGDRFYAGRSTSTTSQVVSHENSTGYYSFNGGNSDRDPIVPDYDWLDRAIDWFPFSDNFVDEPKDYRSISLWKKSARVDVKANHLPLWTLINPPVDGSEIPELDPSDRFVTPEQIVSTIVNSDKDFSVNDDALFYHSHSAYHEHDPATEDGFIFGLLTKKELQFLYELVSQVFYGGKEKTLEDKKYVCVWEPWLMNGDRWAEIRTKVNMSVRHSSTNIGVVADNIPILETSHAFLKDYILWAAPTYEQYHKKDFSKLILEGSRPETFVSLYEQKIKGKNPINPSVAIDAFLKRAIDTTNQHGYSYWEHPCIFPFHGMAKEIIQSETSARPLVPAWAHLNSISRYNNKLEKKMGDVFGKNATITNNTILETCEESDDSGYCKINRVLGGNLLALPRFVLGGRVDLGEDPKNWDPNWGECPFHYTKNGELIVGSLDAVLDNWAKQNKYDGKYYVSAMEILFWIRFRHGIASAPSNQRIDMSSVLNQDTYDSKTDIKNNQIWPANIGLGGGELTTFRALDSAFVINRLNEPINAIGFTQRLNFNGTERTETEFLETETLNNLSMLTSHYIPIFADSFNPGTELYTEQDVRQIKISNADPLMEITTNGKNGPFTGWNTNYVCNWPGQKNNVKIQLQSSFIDEIVEFVDNITDPTNAWFNKTKIDMSSIIPYQLAHKIYRNVGFENNQTKHGFSARKRINTTDIQAAFRAYKLLQVDSDYSDFVRTGLTKRQGERGSVVMTLGNFYPNPDEKPNEFYQTTYFVSGDNNEDRSILEDGESHNYLDMRTKPWRTIFSAPEQQHINSRWLSDWSLGGGCSPEKYVYMRHLIKPFIIPYDNHFNRDNQYGWYDTEKRMRTYSHYGRMLEFHTIYGLFGGALSPENLQFGGSILSSKKGTLIQYPDSKQSGPNWTRGMKRNGLKKIVKVLYMSNKIVENTTELSTLLSTLTGLNENVVKVISKFSRYIFWTNGVLSKFGSFSSNMNIWYTSSFIYKYVSIVDKFKSNYWDLIWPLISAVSSAISRNPSDPSVVYQQFFDLGVSLPIKYSVAQLNRAYISSYAKKAFDTAINEAIASGAGSGQTAVSVAGLATGGALTNLGISVMIYFILLEIEFSIKAHLDEVKLDSYWKYIDDATENNWIEGIYLESKGKIRIPKSEITEILSNFVETGQKDVTGRSTFKREHVVKNNGTILFNTNPPNLTVDDEPYEKWVKEQNKIFYDTYLDNNILPKINPGDCECDFIMDLIVDTPQGTQRYKEIKDKYNVVKSSEYGNPNNRNFPNKGLFRRAWKSLDGGERHKILDDAPVGTDMPLIKMVSPRPLPISPEAIFNGRSDGQISYFQIPPVWIRNYSGQGQVDVNYRLNGVNAFYVLYADCPRFWWPLISNVDGDFCDYIAKNGRYPKRPPEVYSPCDGTGDTAYSVLSWGSDQERNRPYSLNVGPGKLLQSVQNDYNQKPGAWGDQEPTRTNLVGTDPKPSGQDSHLLRYSRSFFASGAKTSRIGHGIPWPQILQDAVPGGKIPYLKTNSIVGPFWDGLSYSEYFTNQSNSNTTSTDAIKDSGLNNFRVSVAGGINSKKGQDVYNKYWGGNGVVAMEGVFGMPVPHERELVRLFRKKFGIDLIEKNDGYYGYCCMPHTVIDELSEWSREVKNSPPTWNNTFSKIQSANNCRYVIKLNDTRFFNKMITKCLGTTVQKKDNNPQPPNHSQLMPESMADYDAQILIDDLRRKRKKVPYPPPPGGEQDPVKIKEEFSGPCIGIPIEQCTARLLPGTQTVNEIIPKEEETKPNPASEHLTVALANEVSTHLRGAIQAAMTGIATALPEWKVGSRKIAKFRRENTRATPLAPGESGGYWLESELDGTFDLSKLPGRSDEWRIVKNSEYTEDIYQNIFGQRYSKNSRGERNFSNNLLRNRYYRGKWI